MKALLRHASELNFVAFILICCKAFELFCAFEFRIVIKIIFRNTCAWVKFIYRSLTERSSGKETWLFSVIDIVSLQYQWEVDQLGNYPQCCCVLLPTICS